MPINGSFTPYEREQLKKAIAYIEDHYNKTFSTENVSLEVGLDIKLLQKGIKLLTGFTIHHYQMKLRVERALVDLMDYSTSIKCIAIKHGFSSTSHFGTEFKKLTGKSPKEYRFQQLG